MLVVEDQPGVRRFVTRILARHGYVVLEANGPTEARTLFEEHGRAVDLLITDVVMPHTGGPALAAELCELNRDLRVLFMSGYAGGDLESESNVLTHFAMLEKPFTASVLLQATHDVLADKS